MEVGLLAIIGIMTAFVLLIYLGSNYLERRYYEKHPPDDWDGCREDTETDDDDDVV